LFVAVLAAYCRIFSFDLMLASQSPISVKHGTDPLYENNVVLIAVLSGDLSNALCCLA
jgi:hypothetical protein